MLLIKIEKIHQMKVQGLNTVFYVNKLKNEKHFGKLFFRVLIVFCLFFLSFTEESIAQSTKRYRLKTIVIDPGHGGRDPGAVGKICYEKNVVLPISLMFGQLIEKHFKDVRVVYTRKSDTFVELKERAEIANRLKADLFISIHANASLSKKIYGAESYAMGLHTSERNMEVAKRENSVIVYEENYSTKYEGYNPESHESFIAFSLMQHAYLDQSLIFASKVQEQFSNRIRRKDNGVRQAGFLVLWETSMPSVLVELGYISNAKEEKYLVTDKAHRELAYCLFLAFKEYKSIVENKSEFTSMVSKNKNTASGTAYKPGETTTKPRNLKQTTKKAATENTSKNNLVHFEVQICASKSKVPLSSSKFKGLQGVREFRYQGMYKYSVGNASKYDEIIRIQQNVRQKIPDAFIIAFYGGKKISVKEAKRIQQVNR